MRAKFPKILLAAFIPYLLFTLIASLTSSFNDLPYLFNDWLYLFTMSSFVLYLPIVIALLIFDKLIVIGCKKLKLLEKILPQIIIGTFCTIIFAFVFAYFDQLQYYDWDFSQARVNFIQKVSIAPNLKQLCMMVLFIVFTICMYHFIVFKPFIKLKKNTYW